MRCLRCDQIGLRGHDGVDVLIAPRHFIEAGGEQFDAALGEPFRQTQGPERSRMGSFLVALQVKDCIAFVRLITRPTEEAEGNRGGR